MNLSIHEIECLQHYFKEKPVFKVFLFGSTARDEATLDSDVDLLLELDYSKPLGWEFVQMQWDLEKLLSRKVDLVTERSISKHIRAYIDKDKIAIYEK